MSLIRRSGWRSHIQSLPPGWGKVGMGVKSPRPGYARSPSLCYARPRGHELDGTAGLTGLRRTKKGGECKPHSPPGARIDSTRTYLVFVPSRAAGFAEPAVRIPCRSRSLSIIRKRNYYGQTFCSRICPLGPKTSIELGGVTLTV